jgi:hypothetical protein
VFRTCVQEKCLTDWEKVKLGFCTGEQPWDLSALSHKIAGQRLKETPNGRQRQKGQGEEPETEAKKAGLSDKNCA